MQCWAQNFLYLQRSSSFQDYPACTRQVTAAAQRNAMLVSAPIIPFPSFLDNAQLQETH